MKTYTVYSRRYSKELPVLQIVRSLVSTERYSSILGRTITIPEGAYGFACGTQSYGTVYVVWDNRTMLPECWVSYSTLEIIKDFTTKCDIKPTSSNSNLCSCLLPDAKLSYAGIGPAATPFHVCKSCKKEIINATS